MRNRISCPARAARTVGAVGTAFAIAGCIAGSAAASVPVDLRVVASDAGNIADVRQYVPTTTTVKTFAGDDCFDQTPPIKQSSGASYPIASPTMLSAIWEASQVVPALQPVRLSDADYASFGALGVCQINSKAPPGFFLLKANNQALTVGADLFPVNPGDELVAYRTPEDFSSDEELELAAPARIAPGVAFNVNVRAYTTMLAPKVGAVVTGGDGAATTDTAGNATVSFANPGRYTLVATGDYNDIPSRSLQVCVAPEPATACPAERGREIIGSDEAEGIKGTDGDDVIRARGGNDKVKAGGGADRIVVKGGGRDFVSCGGGKDVVRRDRRDRLAKSCESPRSKAKKDKGGNGGEKEKGGKGDKGKGGK